MPAVSWRLGYSPGGWDCRTQRARGGLRAGSGSNNGGQQLEFGTRSRRGTAGSLSWVTGGTVVSQAEAFRFGEAGSALGRGTVRVG